MTVTPTTSLVDRAGLDRDRVRHHLTRGLEGANDGELFLEYRQAEVGGAFSIRALLAPVGVPNMTS